MDEEIKAFLFRPLPSVIGIIIAKPEFYAGTLGLAWLLACSAWLLGIRIAENGTGDWIVLVRELRSGPDDFVFCILMCSLTTCFIFLFFFFFKSQERSLK